LFGLSDGSNAHVLHTKKVRYDVGERFPIAVGLSARPFAFAQSRSSRYRRRNSTAEIFSSRRLAVLSSIAWKLSGSLLMDVRVGISSG
jgi:hypothetical protein